MVNTQELELFEDVGQISHLEGFLPLNDGSAELVAPTTNTESPQSSIEHRRALKAAIGGTILAGAGVLVGGLVARHRPVVS